MSREPHIQQDQRDHDSAQSHIAELVGRGKKVLDLGRGAQERAAILREKYDCRVWGIEADETSANAAGKHCEEVVVGDLEVIDLSAHYEKGQFDTVILADVPGRVRSPESVVAGVRDLFSEALIISAPNFANTAVICDLMKGRFDPASLGISDSPNVHLFTKDSLLELLEKSGLVAERFLSLQRAGGGSETKSDAGDCPEEVLTFLDSQAETKFSRYIVRAVKRQAAPLSSLHTIELERRISSLEVELQTKEEAFAASLEAADSRTLWYHNKLREHLNNAVQLKKEIDNAKGQVAEAAPLRQVIEGMKRHVERLEKERELLRLKIGE